MARVVGLVRSLIVLALVFGLINGALWVYWNNAHGQQHKEYEELGVWLKDTKVQLSGLKNKAENTTDQDEFNQLQSQYNDLLDEYNSKVDQYNNDVDVINSEFYLIPIPGKSKE